MKKKSDSGNFIVKCGYDYFTLLTSIIVNLLLSTYYADLQMKPYYKYVYIGQNVVSVGSTAI